MLASLACLFAVMYWVSLSATFFVRLSRSAKSFPTFRPTSSQRSFRWRDLFWQENHSFWKREK